MKTATIAIVALFVLPLLPIASAGTPAAEPWAPYDAGSTVSAIAISADGFTVASALRGCRVPAASDVDPSAPTTAPPPPCPSSGAPGAPTTPTLNCPIPPDPTNPCIPNPSGGPKSPNPSDLAIFDAEAGFVYNGTGAASDTTGNTLQLGRDAVAVSADGTTVASLGFDTRNADPNVPGTLKLYYQRVPAGTRFSTNPAASNASLFLRGTPAGLIVSADGNRVVVGINDHLDMSILGYTWAGSSLIAAFNYTTHANLSAIAGSRDLTRIVAGGSVIELNETHGVLFQIPFSAGTPSATLYERSFNGTVFTSVALSANGLRALAGDSRSRLYAVDSDATTARVTTMPGAVQRVQRVVLSDDGLRAVAAHSGTLAAYAIRPTLPPALVWNTTINGFVRDLASNATGETVLAAVNGTDGGAYAFGDVDGTVLWKASGNVDAIDVNANGTLAAYAQRQIVTVARIPRQIVFEFPGGGKTGPTASVKSLGTAAFDLTVRNPGAALEKVTFRTSRDPDFTVTADPPVLAVPPGESKKVTIFVSVPRSLASQRTFNVTAASLGSTASDEVTLSIVPLQTSAVTLVYSGNPDIPGSPGVRSDVVLAVVNNGTGAAAVGIRTAQAVSAGQLWDVKVDPESLTLAPNSLTTIRVSVTPPGDSPNGTSDQIVVTLSGTNVSDSASFTLRINPRVGVSIDASPRTKLVEPGKAAFYNVTVTNNGSLPRKYAVFNDPGASQGGKTWGIDVDSNPFRLHAGAQRTLEVKIFAPPDATPNDRVSFIVRARTVPEEANETFLEANLTLFANAIAPIPTTTTPPAKSFLPAPGLAVVVLSIATLSFVLRLRRRAP